MHKVACEGKALFPAPPLWGYQQQILGSKQTKLENKTAGSVHCPNTNLGPHMKTEPVTAGADSMVLYVCTVYVPGLGITNRFFELIAHFL